MSVLSNMAIATAINSASAVKKGDDPLPTVIAAGVFTFVLLYVSDANPRLGSTFAGVFLLGTFMVHYQVFLDLLDYITVPAAKGN